MSTTHDFFTAPQETQKNGRPWFTSGPFQTYDLALANKREIAELATLEVKIKHLSDGFYVKTRKTEAAIKMEELKKQEKIAEKKLALENILIAEQEEAPRSKKKLSGKGKKY